MASRIEVEMETKMVIMEMRVKQLEDKSASLESLVNDNVKVCKAIGIAFNIIKGIAALLVPAAGYIVTKLSGGAL